MGYLFLFGSLGLFLWLLLPDRSRSKRDERSGMAGGSQDADQAVGLGTGSGLVGGDIADAAVARYALSRTPKDSKSSDARDVGTAIGLSRTIQPPPGT